MSEDDEPVAFTALVPGVPVVTRDGRTIGSVVTVLADPDQDIFHGLVVSTPDGRRFVSRDQVELMTRARVVCGLTDDEVSHLPASPPGAEREPETIFASTGPSTRSGPSGRFVTVVRCMRGGLFQALWVPGVSFTAVRLGPYRIMRCPVHDRVELVRMVDESALTREELEQAARYPAGRIP